MGILIALPWRKSWILVVALLGLLGCSPIDQEASEERSPAISSSDVDYLAQYGDWVNSPTYGDVWCPRVESSWEPFYYGRWVWTDDGWLWESYEPYGWLVYHHGNWYRTPELGWFWIPADAWSVASVQWSEFGDYIAWAPSPPPGVILPSPWQPQGIQTWQVVRVHDFLRENVGKYKVVRNVQDLSIGKEINQGQPPDIVRVEKATKTTITAQTVHRQPQQMGSRTYYKVVMPAAEAKKSKAMKAEVQKEVLTKKKAEPAQDEGKSKPAEHKHTGEKKTDNEPQKTEHGKRADSTSVGKPSR